jgi:hypothetical protein
MFGAVECDRESQVIVAADSRKRRIELRLPLPSQFRRGFLVEVAPLV